MLALGADGSVVNRYLWGPGVNQLLADDNYALGLSSPTLWTLGDNQNSIRDLVSSDGTLQQHIAYSPFGQQIVTAAGAFTTEAVCVFGYTGSYTDVLTSDVLNGVRWYDPSSERWLTQDPAAADENLYRYCGNAPTDGTDPSGLAAPRPVPPAVPTPDGEKQFLIDLGQWLKDNGGIRKTSRGVECEEQANDFLSKLQGYNLRYWKPTSYNRNRRNWGRHGWGVFSDPNGSLHFQFATEKWNVVRFDPRPKTNPNGQAFVISPFWGYQNEDPSIFCQSLNDFQSDYPLRGDFDPPPPSRVRDAPHGPWNHPID